MKKGFTLIELLAVILILGIIALIAIPTVNNILKEARRGAFSSTLTNIEKAIENECTLNQIKNNEINYTYTITDGIISPSVEIKGDLPDGTIYVDGECKVNYTLYNNNFSAVKENKEIKIEDKKIYTEDILNGAVPVLSNNLIPVTIDNDGTVRKADIYEKWYSYEEKLWANAVILTDTGKIEDDGTILEESIESYFVWVPRYKYKLFDMGNYNSVINETPTGSNAKTVEIIFENKNNQISLGDEIGEYYSHPAFGAFNSNGLWIAKFEISGSLNDITIKPNKISLKNISIKSAFETSMNYDKINNSHMMKNTEWGAVVYLSYSKYGINNKINVNKSSNYTTGYSLSSTNELFPYNTETGYLASTTGNISGIYDMSGGSYEFMASYLEDSLGSSGFMTDPSDFYGSKYFDKYPKNSSDNSYNNRILGDATGELGPFYSYDKESIGIRYYNNWHKEIGYFPNPSSPWIDRGGAQSHNNYAGQGYFGRNSGAGDSYLTFRIILTN